MSLTEEDLTLLNTGRRGGAGREPSVFETRRVYLGEELVVEDLIQGESVTGGFLQDS